MLKPLPLLACTLALFAMVGCRSKQPPELYRPGDFPTWRTVDQAVVQDRVERAQELPLVTFETDFGPITIELYEEEAPATVRNFLQYVEGGHYRDTIFHRVIPGFMVQGGGFTADMTEKPTGAPVENESDNNLRNRRGTVAMARTEDPDSATAQFYINLVDNAFLDGGPGEEGYTVFGRVVEGMEVVDQIATVETTILDTFADVPVEPVTILSARRER